MVPNVLVLLPKCLTWISDLESSLLTRNLYMHLLHVYALLGHISFVFRLRVPDLRKGTIMAQIDKVDFLALVKYLITER